MRRIRRLLLIWLEMMMMVNLERTGDGRWYVKNTNFGAMADEWLAVIRGEVDEDDEFPLPGA